MEFQDVVRGRKMVRSFQDRPLDPAMVERILANAQRAPSAGYSQGYGFIVFDGRHETERFWSVAWGDRERSTFAWPTLFNAPLIVVPCSEKDVYLRRYALEDKGWTDLSESHWPVPYWDIDAAMASMAILLTAVDLELGALFFGLFRLAEFKAAFGVPERVTPLGAIAIGHPAPGDPPSPSIRRVGRRPRGEMIHRGRW